MAPPAAVLGPVAVTGQGLGQDVAAVSDQAPAVAIKPTIRRLPRSSLFRPFPCRTGSAGSTWLPRTTSTKRGRRWVQSAARRGAEELQVSSWDEARRYAHSHEGADRLRLLTIPDTDP